VLGPLLFLIFMKDLEDDVAGNVLMFADDTKLYGIVDDVLHGQRLYSKIWEKLQIGQSSGK